MTLAAWRREHEEETLGPLIYAEIAAIVRQVIRSYDPRVYADGDWKAGSEDLLQEVVLERMLGEGQLAYAMTVAVDEGHWRALVVRQVKRTLARRRQRSVVDNLLERSEEILSRSPFLSSRQGRVIEYWQEGSDPEGRRPSDEELRAAILAATSVPITRGQGSERAPMVYSSPALEALLLKVAATLPCRFTRTDLDRILRGLLTQWVTGDLMSIEGALQLPSESLSPEEQAVVNDIAARILASTDQQGRMILRAKIDQVSDGEIAGRLGLSRPTVASRKAALLGRIQEELAGLSGDAADAVVAQLASLLAEPRWSES